MDTVLSIHFLAAPGACKSTIAGLLVSTQPPWNMVHWSSDIHGPQIEGGANLRSMAKQIALNRYKPFLDRFDRPSRAWVLRHLPDEFNENRPTVVVFDICGNASSFVTSKGYPTKAYAEVLLDPRALFLVQDPTLVSGTLGVLAHRTNHPNLAVTDADSLRSAVKIWAYMNSAGRNEFSFAMKAFGDRSEPIPGFKSKNAAEIEDALRQFHGFARNNEDPPNEAFNALVRLAPGVEDHRLPLDHFVVHIVNRISETIRASPLQEVVLQKPESFPLFYAYQVEPAPVWDALAAYIPEDAKRRTLHLTALYLGRKMPADEDLELARRLESTPARQVTLFAYGVVRAFGLDGVAVSALLVSTDALCQPSRESWTPHMTLQSIGIKPSAAGVIAAESLRGGKSCLGLTVDCFERFEPVALPGTLVSVH